MKGYMGNNKKYEGARCTCCLRYKHAGNGDHAWKF